MTIATHRQLIIAGTVTAAVGINLVIRLIGRAAGGEFTYRSNGETASSTPVLVAMETLVPLAVGLVLATVLAIKWPRIATIAQVIGAFLAIATAAGALLTDFDSTTSKVSLALMHIVVAVSVVLGLRAIAKTLP